MANSFDEIKDCSLSSSNPTRDDADVYIKTLLNNELPKFERSTVESNLRWNFILNKHLVQDKPKKKIKKKKLFLTRKERKKLNLLKLPRTGWKRNELQVMHNMWKDYMRSSMNFIKKVPAYDDLSRPTFNTTVGKCELIGAEITVIRSVMPSIIGMTGIVVLETKATLQIVTQSDLKILLKKSLVFTFQVDNMLFTVFGKHITVKPSDRSVRKIKTFLLPDL